MIISLPSPRPATCLRGSSLIEFALGMAVLAPLVVGLARFGATVYVMDQLGVAARNAAEYASTQPVGLLGEDPEFVERVRNVAIHSSPDGAGEARIPGLSREDVIVRVERDNGVPRAVTVWTAGYEAPGGAVNIPEGPRVTFPFRGRIAGESTTEGGLAPAPGFNPAEPD